jgi:hypothetical protein
MERVIAKQPDDRVSTGVASRACLSPGHAGVRE